MFNIGNVCVKIAGRDAGKRCVVVEEHENNIVLIEGATRRRKCNIKHLERTGETVKVKKSASHADVMKALGLEPRTSKPKKAGERPRRARKVRDKTKDKKVAEKPEKKSEKGEKSDAPGVTEKPDKKVEEKEKSEVKDTPKRKKAKKSAKKKVKKKKAVKKSAKKT